MSSAAPRVLVISAACILACGSTKLLDESELGHDKEKVVPLDPVNAAKAGWDVIQSGRPTTSVTTDYADALPVDIPFSDVTEWVAAPQVTRLRHYDKRFGVTRVHADLACVWYYGGRYKGRGRFLNHAHVAVAKLIAGWQQNVSVRADVGRPMNAHTAEDPLAVLPLALTISRNGLFGSDVHSWQASLRGDGTWDVIEL